MSGSLLLSQGAPDRALPRLEAALRQQPQDGEILETYANTCFMLKRWPEAVAAYRAAWQAGRRHPDLLNNLGMSLKETGEVDAAIAAYQEALRSAPDDAMIHNNLAIALNRKHDYEGAIAAYRRSTELDPANADVWGNLATLYEQSNMLEEARAAVERGLVHDPGQQNLQLIAARCERRSGELEPAVMRLHRELKRDDLAPVVRRSMEFELGRDLDQLGEAEAAYPHFAAGNALTPQVWDMRAGADAFLQDLDQRLSCFAQGLPSSWPPSLPEERRSPVFLVGFPRSGTTLMDTILDAHPRVSVLEEAPALENVVNEVRKLPGGYPRALASLKPAEISSLRQAYWREVDAELGPAAKDSLVLDKNPFYSAHAAFIHLLFPGARFILALRHPCDVALSCFMQAFGNNPVLDNFRSLQDTAATYRRVMDLWLRYRELLPLVVHDLRYEALVADKQKEIAALLGFLGLEWEEAMQDHTGHAKKRGRIYTPSYHQVIRPVYGDAVERWRRYRGHFGQALEALRPYAERFGYSVD
jgi:tetratricopeptide (TPR) repeat protein